MDMVLAPPTLSPQAWQQLTVISNVIVVSPQGPVVTSVPPVIAQNLSASLTSLASGSTLVTSPTQYAEQDVQQRQTAISAIALLNTAPAVTTQSAGGNTATQSASGNTATQSSGGNTATQSSGGNTATQSSGGNTATQSASGNTATQSAGGNIASILQGLLPSQAPVPADLAAAINQIFAKVGGLAGQSA